MQPQINPSYGTVLVSVSVQNLQGQEWKALALPTTTRISILLVPPHQTNLGSWVVSPHPTGAKWDSPSPSGLRHITRALVLDTIVIPAGVPQAHTLLLRRVVVQNGERGIVASPARTTATESFVTRNDSKNDLLPWPTDWSLSRVYQNHEFQTPIPYGKHETSRPSRSCEVTISLGDGIPGIPGTGKTTLSCPYTAWRCTRNCLRLPAGRRILRPRSDTACFRCSPDPMAKPLEIRGHLDS